MAYADSKTALQAPPRSIDPSEIAAAIVAVTDDLDAAMATKVTDGMDSLTGRMTDAELQALAA